MRRRVLTAFFMGSQSDFYAAVVAAVVAAVPLVAQEKAQETVIDSQRGTIHHSRRQIHMLSAAAGDHTTNIPISLGTIRESTAPQHSSASKRRG